MDWLAACRSREFRRPQARLYEEKNKVFDRVWSFGPREVRLEEQEKWRMPGK
ncbi:Protein of unknown function [Pyronema omphalodes CBS 100304]|uniref:Uncharacterized protein n=1 Tax=Pyronema omphalodes (strain CBS 100304) TaxID=1076935 RepID=U4LPC8_PYROM|nr:Protein of unknown function [Pyronema omphalodes CBS 100304]